MSDFEKIRDLGFHAALIEGLVRNMNEGEVPQHNLFQLEAAFDDESVFRHFDYLGLCENLLTTIHVDELAEGVRWYLNLIPLSTVTSVEAGQFEEATGFTPQPGLPLAAEEPPGLTVVVLFSAHRSLELDPLHCDDPSCTADHGLAGSSKDEGLAMTFVDGAESSSEAEALAFVGALASQIAHA